MRRLIAVLAVGAAATALPIVTAGPAAATPAPRTVSILDCFTGVGLVVLDPASPTRLACRFGTYNGRPVGGI
jgi:hypothetical protein